MLEIEEINLLGSTPCVRWRSPTNIGLSSFSSHPVYYVVPQGQVSVLTREERLPCEFLNQGGQLYQRDNAVENFQVNGTAQLMPKALGDITMYTWPVLYPSLDYKQVVVQAGQFYSNIAPGKVSGPKFYSVPVTGGLFFEKQTPRDGDSPYALNNRSSDILCIGSVEKEINGHLWRIPYQVLLGVNSVRSDGTPYSGSSYYPFYAYYGMWPSHPYWESTTWRDVPSSVYSKTMLETQFKADFKKVPSRTRVTQWCREKMQEILPQILVWIYDNFPVPSSSFEKEKFDTLEDVFGPVHSSGSLWDLTQLGDTMRSLTSDNLWSSDELSLHARDVVDEYNAFSSNMLAYIADLGKTGDTIRTIAKLPKDLKNPKAWASAWLSGRYGDRLFVADTKELLESVAKECARGGGVVPSRVRMSDSITLGPFTGSKVRTSSVFIANESLNGLMTGVNNLMRWDLWPTLENTWDLVPLSFVVDWVLPVQDLLGQIDSAIQSPYLKVIAAYASDAVNVTGHLAADGCIAALTFKYYRRYAHNALADLKPFTVQAEPPSFSVIHAGDALALLVQFSR